MCEFVLPAKLDIQKAFDTPPDEKYIWSFKEGTKTFFQIDYDTPKKETEWYLTHLETDDPARSYELHNSLDSVVDTLIQVSQKTWTDDAQVLKALLPALRAAMYDER